MTRAEAKQRNRQALLDAARHLGPRATLEEIAERAELTTGAVYSLFGSKNGLLVALVTECLGAHHGGIEEAAPAGMSLIETVAVVAGHYRRLCDDPEALPDLSFEISLQDLALRDPELAPRLAASVRAHHERLTALLAGRVHNGTELTRRQARHLATALRALMVGLSQSVILGFADTTSREYLAAARALVTPDVLGPP